MEESDSATSGSVAARGANSVPFGVRFLAALGTWLLFYFSTPGIGRAGGFGHIAFLALAPWGLWCSRPGPKAFLAEWLAGTLGLALVFGWLCHVVPGITVPISMVLALYFALGGVVLRRLARRVPLALAVPVAWMAFEMLRWYLPHPLSVGWIRLGTMAHDTGWLAGSARIFGVWGLSYMFAAFGGWFADLRRIKGADAAHPAPFSRRTCTLFGLAPVVTVIALSYATSAPETIDGPRVMIVQPAIAQERKNFAADPFREYYADVCSLTAEGLAEIRAAGEPTPDLVAWGEAMLISPVTEAGLAAAFRSGARPLPWTEHRLDVEHITNMVLWEMGCVQAVLFGERKLLARVIAARFEELARSGHAWAQGVLDGEAMLPEGTSFLAGAVYFFVEDGAIRRQNAVFLWEPDGLHNRSAPAAKVQLVPGAEYMAGLERWDAVRRVAKAVGGYIPDMLPGERTEVLSLRTQRGRVRIATTVCFDNAFDGPYTVPVREGEVDFHLIASNEAWYETGVEMDQMVAFARLRAIMTGRSLVRVANAGISIVIDPEGRDVALLELDGRRKMVRGTLRATVPIPVRDASGAAPKTFYVRTERWQIGAWWAGIALFLAIAGRRPVTGVGRSARPHPDAGRAPSES